MKYTTASLLCMLTTAAQAQTGPEVVVDATQRYALVKGQMMSFTTVERYKDIIVGDPNVTDISAFTDKMFVIKGAGVGSAFIMVIDVQGNVLHNIQITVSSVQTETPREHLVTVPGKYGNLYWKWQYKCNSVGCTQQHYNSY